MCVLDVEFCVSDPEALCVSDVETLCLEDTVALCLSGVNILHVSGVGASCVSDAEVLCVSEALCVSDYCSCLCVFKIQNTQEIKRTLFNKTKQDKICQVSR